jgi:sugar phosphate permease
VLVAGMLGSSAISASGRAVFGWFPRDERGLALRLRQTAVAGGAAAASLSLPPLAAAAGPDAALYALAGAMLAGSVTAAL